MPDDEDALESEEDVALRKSSQANRDPGFGRSAVGVGVGAGFGKVTTCQPCTLGQHHACEAESGVKCACDCRGR